MLRYLLRRCLFQGQRILSSLLFVISLFLTHSAFAHALSTLDITQRTLAATKHCLHYRVTGICFWLDCEHGVCTTNTTLRVAHDLPDAVVSVYQKTHRNPWRYAEALNKLAYPIGNAQIENQLGHSLGYGQMSASNTTDMDTHFKEVDVIGNPALAVLARFNEIFITSIAKPFKPYYVSLADSNAWRSPLIEMALSPQYVLPGMRTVGSVLNSWGNVYPRTGFILQSNDAKAAAVIAQRAADIVTHTHQSHIYQSLSTSCGNACDISETQENDRYTQWQMIYPLPETTCAVFGESDTNTMLPWKFNAAQAGDGDYVWVLWRHYHGCIQGKGKYLGSVGL
jgi:integrating conjugative element protein (TIGR03756 family)